MRKSVLLDILRALGALFAAFLFYSFLGTVGPAALVVVNGFSLAVVAFAVRKGEIFGAVLGTACGLVQDTFSLGIFGVGGLTKTLLGFWTGYVARRIDITPGLRSAAFLFVMSTLELILWILLGGLVLGQRVNLHGGLIFLQPFTTAFLGSSALFAVRRIEARRA